MLSFLPVNNIVIAPRLRGCSERTIAEPNGILTIFYSFNYELQILVAVSLSNITIAKLLLENGYI